MYGKRLALGATAVALVVGMPGALSSAAGQSAKRGLVAFSLYAETQNEFGGTASTDALRLGLLFPDGTWRLIAEGMTPAFSPNGRVLAIAHYRHERRGKYSSPSGIVLHRLDGTPIRRLTFGEDVSPTWSPSGRKLAFTRWDCVGSRPCIFTIGRDGDDRRLLVKNGYNPSWSARSQIAFQRQRDDYAPTEIWTTTPTGTHVRQLTHPKRNDAGAWGPDWSPRGNKLVFALSTYRRGNWAGGLAVMNSDGTDQHWLLKSEDSEELFAENPIWSPDGRQVAFEYGADLYTIAANGKTPPVVLMEQPPLKRWCPYCRGRKQIWFEGFDWQPVVPRRPLTTDCRTRHSLHVLRRQTRSLPGATLHSMGGLREPDASAAKRCRRCGTTKPREAFSPDRDRRDRVHSWCRSCVAEAKRRWRAENRESYNAARRIDPYPPRKCATCGQDFTPVRMDQRYCCRWCREHRYLARVARDSGR